MLEALLWDVDGTLAETERDGHRVAFNRAFEASGLPWRWDEARYGELLRVTGGRERLLADMATRADAPVLADERDALARELHRLKNGFYADLVQGGDIPLRTGVRALIEAAAARGLRQGIVTTTSRINVDALLTCHLGAGWAERFAAVVSGEDVAAKKPAPEGYRRALAMLRLAPPAALAIEDSCAGAAAARGADVPVVVTRSVYFAAEVVDQAVAIGPGLHTRRGWQPAPAAPEDAAVTLDDLVGWHARMEWVRAHG
jgi:HAD superfamily hydrolase (TIGR01509 family)